MDQPSLPSWIARTRCKCVRIDTVQSRFDTLAQEDGQEKWDGMESCERRTKTVSDNLASPANRAGSSHLNRPLVRFMQ